MVAVLDMVLSSQTGSALGECDGAGREDGEVEEEAEEDLRPVIESHLSRCQRSYEHFGSGKPALSF